MTLDPKLVQRAVRSRALRVFGEVFETEYHRRLHEIHQLMDPFEYRKARQALTPAERTELDMAADRVPDHQLAETIGVCIDSLNGTMFRRYGMGAMLRRTLCEVRSLLVDARYSLSYGDVISATISMSGASALIEDLMSRRHQGVKRAERVLIDDPMARREVGDVAHLISESHRSIKRTTWGVPA